MLVSINILVWFSVIVWLHFDKAYVYAFLGLRVLCVCVSWKLFCKLGRIAFFVIRFVPESNNDLLFVLQIRIPILIVVFVFVYSAETNTNE